ncbi:MAG: outer membrane lipoprotein-sorting protein [Gammaproteobacteria bacterium]|nr:outer membrane lipoprotein-sorting protein [Gammaproteobacteria bacterium]
MNTLKKITTTLLIITSQSVMASNTLPTGEQVAKNINARNEGISLSRNMQMILTDKRGKQRIRETIAYRKYFGEEKRTVIHYLSPRNVKKTAFLTYDYPDIDKDDDQWLYLPAMRKVRRISASDRGDYFLGTDLTYEDIKKESKVTLEDYTRNTLRKEDLNGHTTYVIEAIPVNDEIAEELGYGKVIQWVDKNIWMTRKSEFYDSRGKLLKTTLFKDIKQVDSIWTSHRLEVNNHKTGHKTIFNFSNIVYDKEVRDDFFTQRAIRRGL